MANNGFKPNKDCIYYKKYNLCVEFMLMEDMDKRSAAFAKGGPEGVDIVCPPVDTTASEFPGFIKGRAFPARSIMQVDWSRGGDAIVADNSITTRSKIWPVRDICHHQLSLAMAARMEPGELQPG